MDASLTQRRQSLEDKIPDIKKTLHMVEFLQEKRVCATAMFDRHAHELSLGGQAKGGRHG